ncbi:MAG: hypothetical protein GWN62_03855 [Aliifodinibius sp.]|nr:hypothetical protein [Fodinibius sp.]
MENKNTQMSSIKNKPVIGLVGPCKSGKTILKQKLTEHGYQVKHIAQEHSYVKDMWRKIANPDILIYLDVSYQGTLDRSSLTWESHDYQEQLIRLSHALDHANLFIKTDDKTPEEILKIVLDYLSTAEE